eukprot:1506023-Alexandrium_andersonii.AAC.1
MTLRQHSAMHVRKVTWIATKRLLRSQTRTKHSSQSGGSSAGLLAGRATGVAGSASRRSGKRSAWSSR